MVDELEKIGMKVNADDFKCEPCDATRAGGYAPGYGVLLCQNRLESKSHQERTMVHEMVHMYDNQRFKVDWTNLRHHACSEVSQRKAFSRNAASVVFDINNVVIIGKSC